MPINKTIEDLIASLNAKQLEAVKKTEGPVLVIAGPGTGKTQVLAIRIANILSTTDSLPENILCLTYTDAGTIAMRKRLFEFIGSDAYRLEIFTFHAFCNMVIQENLDYFGLRGIDAISELEQIQLVHDIIDVFGKEHPLKRYTGDVYYETGKLLNLFQNMKRENWSTEHISKKCDEYITDIETRDEYLYKKDSKYGKKGDKKPSYYEEVKRMNQLKAAADTFNQYQEKLKNSNRYDFADMITWVIDAFAKMPELLRNYQERYLYLLVDEFQDTSGAQNQLLNDLLDYWDEPNVFAVGDDDQSIYRFQGANVENIQQFKKRYKGIQVISLEENYRSSQHILDVANALIQKNDIRINPNKKLIAKNEKYASLDEKPLLKAYHNTFHEIVGITSEIEVLQKEGVKLNEIAVLYRKHAQAELIIKYLQAKNIAVNTKRRVDILQEPLVKKIINILKYVQAENKKAHSGEPYLFELLHYDFLNIEPIDIAKISVKIASKNFNERTTSWREELKDFHAQKADLFSDIKPSRQIEKASVFLESWIKDCANLTIQQLIEKIISESGILFNALTADDKNWNMQLLNTFFDFVKAECSRNSKTKLTDIIETLALMETEGVSLPAERLIYSDDGVNFITTHSSKGLEFEYVFVMGCTSRAWEKSSNNFDFKLPDTLFDIHSKNDIEEVRRLFYVAMTRAKRQLQISYAERDENEKEIEKSCFVAELESNGNLEVKKCIADSDSLIAFEKLVLAPLPISQNKDLFNNTFVDELLQKYTLSVTHLNKYLHCPTAFYFENFIKVPSPKSASATFGSAVHFALERLFKNMNASENKQFAEVEEVVKDFKWFIRRNEDSFTEMEFKRRLEYGEKIIPAYYNRYIHEWNKITSIERQMRNVVVDGVPLNGKLDKLEFDGNFVNVVDYKTGKYENAKKKFKRPNKESVEKAITANKEPSFEDQHGGDYWRQAVFYKILLDYDKTKNWECRSSEFDFIEPEKDSGEFFKEKVSIVPSDMEVVRQQITDSYAKISRKEFAKGCGKEDCKWCNFTQEYYK